MAFTSDDIDKLKEAIAGGALKVRFADGREVTYRSLAEMRQILSMMQNDVSPTSGNRTSVVGF